MLSKMVVVPREKPIIENLNAYYLDVQKLVEHCQGEIGSGGIYFKSYSAEGVIFFDKDDLLYAHYKEKDLDLSGAEAIDQLINSGGHHNLSVNIYQISPDEVYFWASVPSAEKVYEDLSTEFTDLEGLIRKLTSEKLTGYIDVTIADGKEGGLIFIINGNIMGGSFSWDNGKPGDIQKNQELLIRKTRETGAKFNVCRLPLSKSKGVGETRVSISKSSKSVIAMLEELLRIFESTVTSKKNLKTDFNKLLKKKFVENAEKYAFLDPFAGEFEYANRKIVFSGTASSKELINGVINSVKDLAHELGLLAVLINNSAAWSAKNSKIIDDLDVKL
jgi:hypothetical protein